mgnify:CR=1 FL=1
MQKKKIQTLKIFRGEKEKQETKKGKPTPKSKILDT